MGHRVVHGGEAFTGSMLITPEVIASIERVPYDARAVADQVASSGLPGEFGERLLTAS